MINGLVHTRSVEARRLTEPVRLHGSKVADGRTPCGLPLSPRPMAAFLRNALGGLAVAQAVRCRKTGLDGAASHSKLRTPQAECRESRPWAA